jgi:hypothetical protein
MERKPRPPASRDKGRDDRLKAALKANLARRKAQARARSGDQTSSDAEKSSKD